MSWQLEPLAGRRRPESQPTAGFRRRCSALYRSLLGRTDEPTDESARELGPLSGARAAAAPASDWTALVEAVDREVGAREETAGLVLIGPPGGGVAEGLRRWASERDFAVLDPPPPHELLEVHRLDVHAKGTLVLPELHKFYLRHPAGLRALRRLMDALRQRSAGLVLGCDSWAWTYLCKSVHIDALLPEAYAAAALPGAALQAWLRSLYERCGTPTDAFRFFPDEGPVFDEGVDAVAYFDALAHSSRAVPEVALELFRSGLRAGGEASAPSPSATVRVLPPSCWVPVAVPAGLERLDWIVLHTLLLHQGLPENVLHQLLPLDSARVTRSLLTLRGFTHEVEGLWRVRHLAYPQARALLAREGFLTDAF